MDWYGCEHVQGNVPVHELGHDQGCGHGHYNVGAGAGYVNNAKYIWVNNGWGGYRDGWLLYDKNAMFFSGIVESWVKGK